MCVLVLAYSDNLNFFVVSDKKRTLNQPLMTLRVFFVSFCSQRSNNKKINVASLIVQRAHNYACIQKYLH